MCNKAILENGGILSLFLTTTKIKKCVIKLLAITLMQLPFVPDRCKTQKMHDKAIDKYPFVFDSVPD